MIANGRQTFWEKIKEVCTSPEIFLKGFILIRGANGRQTFWEKIKEVCTSPEAFLNVILIILRELSGSSAAG